MKVQETFAEGKTKKLYTIEQNDQLLMEFSDTLPLTGAKKFTLKGKKVINSEISAYLFQYLASYNVPTHFIKTIDEKSFLVKKLDMISFEMKIWNIASNGLSKRLGLKDGTVLETPVLELYLKNIKLKNPLINDYHAYSLGVCDRNEMSAILRIGTKVNAVLKSFFHRKNLTLANFTLEFGRYGSQVILGDEISPDTFTVWARLGDGRLDKNAFMIDSASAKKVYPKLHELLLK